MLIMPHKIPAGFVQSVSRVEAANPNFVRIVCRTAHLISKRLRLHGGDWVNFILDLHSIAEDVTFIENGVPVPLDPEGLLIPTDEVIDNDGADSFYENLRCFHRDRYCSGFNAGGHPYIQNRKRSLFRYETTVLRCFFPYAIQTKVPVTEELALQRVERDLRRWKAR